VSAPRYDYPFTEKEANAAFDEWGCNCGPASLAFALQVNLDAVRHAIPGFAEKRYTSPTMMKSALANLGRPFTPWVNDHGQCDLSTMFMRDMPIALTRVQWEGPWTESGANPKWAYRQTHWIATWRDGKTRFVFDVNGGIMDVDAWKMTVAPKLAALYPRATGGWFPTHVWILQDRGEDFPP
jgi:hypothetical protein